jgi:hypothetical protein
VKLLVDHNLPPRLASALDEIFKPDHTIIALREKFGRSDLKDEDWIPKLGWEGGWAVLSADTNIARKKPSRDLFISAGLVGYFFSPAMQKWALHRQAARVLTIWPQMILHISTTANGVYEMPASGTKFRAIGR